MLQILTLALAIVFSVSNVPPKTVQGDQETPGVSRYGDLETPAATDPPEQQGGGGR